ncbi:hypothetical protein RIF29_21905 [Crotalaria pallida]|uniref:Protein FAR1-RELATED SEQUENCE n=1 Tax=Crotalaria pallida TaxID=3830 RepID=A0AAN9F890_CROPI
METFGLPCAHIFTVLVDLNITEIPDSVVLDRWSMKAKEFVGLREKTPSEDDPSVVICRYTCLMNLCRSLCASSSVSVAKFNESRDKFMVDIQGARSMDGDSNIDDDTWNGERVEDP